MDRAERGGTAGFPPLVLIAIDLFHEIELLFEFRDLLIALLQLAAKKRQRFVILFFRDCGLRRKGRLNGAIFPLQQSQLFGQLREAPVMLLNLPLQR